MKRLASTLSRIASFSWRVLSRFIDRRGLQSATALAYTTLLSVVPLVGVMFSLFSDFPVFDEINRIIEEFVFASLVPEFGRTVQGYLIQFSLNAAQMTKTGVMVLAVIALLLMWEIESAINQSWNIASSRNPVKRFFTCLGVLLIGPVLIGISLYATSYVLTLPLIRSVDAVLMIKTRLLAVLPLFTTTLAFTLLYNLVPNRPVRWRHALSGGLFAAVSFEIAKYAFGFYVKAVPTYEIIYGALAVIPMFLVWIYVSWVIVLLGAQVACCLSEPIERQ